MVSKRYSSRCIVAGVEMEKMGHFPLRTDEVSHSADVQQPPHFMYSRLTCNELGFLIEASVPYSGSLGPTVVRSHFPAKWKPAALQHMALTREANPKPRFSPTHSGVYSTIVYSARPMKEPSQMSGGGGAGSAFSDPSRLPHLQRLMKEALQQRQWSGVFQAFL